MWWRWLLGIILLVLYWRSPIDLLPDFIPRIGFLDDVEALALLWWYLSKKKREQLGSARNQGNESESSFSEKSKSSKSEDHYRTLGISPGATREEIESAYKSLMKQYHPDRVHWLGEELQKVAREKSQAINAAYAALSK